MENYQNYLESSQDYTSVYKDKGFASGHRRTFNDVTTNTSVRPSYNRSDYDAFREDSAVPRDKRSAIKLCNEAYKNVGIIRNIIDLMGDFACQGVSLVHRDKGPESFFKQWFKKVNGPERSERFLNLLYRNGNPVVYRSYATITPKLQTYMKAFSSDIKIEIDDYTKNQIPFKYTFFNPLSLDVKTDGELYLNIASKNMIVANSLGYYSQFNATSFPKHIYDNLPEHIRNSIKNNEHQIKLEKNRLHLAHYKKDDWEQWADPLIFAIIDDIMLLEKMRLADLSALDGAISNIRLWRVGSLEHKIVPNREQINRLRDILANNVGGGTMELVVGPEIDFKESTTDVHKFLGSEKYAAVMNAIYGGLGVPPTLTGSAGNGGGFTNNFISLKTLVERLQYGRSLLVQFWEHEVELVRLAMGFKHAPEIVFDQMSLSDEAAEKALLIQLADRDIISHETILERFKETPKVEKVRLLREVEDREKDGTPEKAGPFHDANFPKEKEKMEMQDKFENKRMDKQFKKDMESQKMDLEQKDRDSKEKTKQARLTGPPAGPGRTAKKPAKSNGRPKNSKDSKPRKQRIAKPRSKPGLAELMVWSTNSWDKVSDTVKDVFLKTFDKSNLRQLNKSQLKELRKINLDVFSNLEAMSDFDENYIYTAIREGYSAPLDFMQLLEENSINSDNMPIDVYNKHVVGLYIEHVLS